LKQYLKNELPSNLEYFVISGFPPNPRKIKRALSLAYFISKNTTILDDSKYNKFFPKGFKDIFPLILIWCVTTLYFFDLADIIRKSPYLLFQICLIVSKTSDIGDLQSRIERKPMGREMGDRER
jgi:hypothetical protein